MSTIAFKNKNNSRCSCIPCIGVICLLFIISIAVAILLVQAGPPILVRILSVPDLQENIHIKVLGTIHCKLSDIVFIDLSYEIQPLNSSQFTIAEIDCKMHLRWNCDLLLLSSGFAEVELSSGMSINNQIPRVNIDKVDVRPSVAGSTYSPGIDYILKPILQFIIQKKLSLVNRIITLAVIGLSILFFLIGLFVLVFERRATFLSWCLMIILYMLFILLIAVLFIIS